MSLNPFNDLYRKLDLLNRKVNQMANATDAAIVKLQGDQAALLAAVGTIETTLTAINTELQAALAAAQNAGATPAQLTELAAVSTSLETATAGIAAAVAAVTTPPVAPPAS